MFITHLATGCRCAHGVWNGVEHVQVQLLFLVLIFVFIIAGMVPLIFRNGFGACLGATHGRHATILALPRQGGETFKVGAITFLHPRNRRRRENASTWNGDKNDTLNWNKNFETKMVRLNDPCHLWLFPGAQVSDQIYVRRRIGIGINFISAGVTASHYPNVIIGSWRLCRLTSYVIAYVFILFVIYIIPDIASAAPRAMSRI